jgi:hypothetical protein
VLLKAKEYFYLREMTRLQWKDLMEGRIPLTNLCCAEPLGFKCNGRKSDHHWKWSSKLRTWCWESQCHGEGRPQLWALCLRTMVQSWHLSQDSLSGLWGCLRLRGRWQRWDTEKSALSMLTTALTVTPWALCPLQLCVGSPSFQPCGIYMEEPWFWSSRC